MPLVDRRIRMLGCLALALALTGCAGFFTSSSSDSGDYIYVANYATRNVAGFEISSGSLTATSNSPYSISDTPYSLAMAPQNDFFYIGTAGGYVYNYLVDPDNGSISEGNSSSNSIYASAMQVDDTESWLIVGDSYNSELHSYAINSSTGELTSASTITLDGAPLHLNITPRNKFIYVTLGSSGVDIASFDSATGSLHLTGNLPHIAGSDQGIASTPDGSYLYVTETFTAGLRGFHINTSNGALTELEGSPFSTGGSPSAVVVDSKGTHAYVTNRGDGTISAYAIDNLGALTQVSGSPFSTGKKPQDLAIDRNSTHLAVVCSAGSSDVELYNINSNGSLSRTATSTSGTDPTNAVAVVATH